MTRLAASRRSRLRPARGYRRMIPIEMRIRMSTMAGTSIPPSRLPSCHRFADLHLKLKSWILAWASYSTTSDLDYQRVPLFISSFLPLSHSTNPFSLPSILAARVSHMNMHELSGVRPGGILKQKSYRPVHSSTRPDVFTFRRTVYLRGKGKSLQELRD